MDYQYERWGNPTFASSKRPPDEDNLVRPESKRSKRNYEFHHGNSTRTAFTIDDYTVGWVCALHIEMAAAEYMLDEVHDKLEKSPDDSNTYVFGSVHHHNIVIACLPMNGYGTNNAAVVATNMRRTFPSIRMFLMVGIGGGAPGKVDIRLGDIVVSTGVIQYDLGKTTQQGGFQPTGITRQPSTALMAAVSALRARHEREFSKVSSILSQMHKQHPHMTPYAYRKELQDFLFDSTYDHAESDKSCDECDKSKLVSRSRRSNNDPMIHYGIIASGNQVMKNANTRDRLAQDFNAICFEMEAAGLMDSYQCLVIRGICDYSDAHKSKEWQKYAAATAAAYTKELLSTLSPGETVPTMGNRETPNEELVLGHRQYLMDSLSFEKIDARHSNIKTAYGKTCAWLLSHPDYIAWLTPAEYPQHHGFLWIHGKPGAGKSTLMKYICSRALENEGTTISFFFNARGDDLEKSTEGMYRSLLLQLLKKLPDLQEVLDPNGHFVQSRGGDSSWQIDVLQRLFCTAITKLGGRRVTCFIDALDECGESQVRDMIEYFEQLGKSALEAEGNLYICFSSRHYPTIGIQHGRTLTLENQPGHSQDLEKYVRSKLQAGRGKDIGLVRAELLKKAAGVFMWVVLVIDILNREFQRGRIFAVKKRLQEIPAELSALFRDILRRDNENMADLLLCIQWILYAKRPLKPEEFYYAIVAGLDPEPENLAEWDPQHIATEDMNLFVSSSSKGLAEITRSKAGTVQFIHESVRDFLLKDGGIRDLWPDLEADFQSQSHDQLKQCCYAYMKTDISRYVFFGQKLPKASSGEAKALRRRVSEKFPFLEYATHQVLYHANAADRSPQHDFLRTFDLGTWIELDNLFGKFETHRHTSGASLLYILAENNLARLINSVLDYEPRVHIDGERYKFPLFAALVNGHREAVKALLQLENLELSEGNIKQDFRDLREHTPLTWAASGGHNQIAHRLLDYGVHVESRKGNSQTPLSWAARNGHWETVQILLNRGANLESKDDRFGETPLSWAAENGHLEAVQILLDRGANLESKDDIYGRTPIWWAVKNGHKDIVQLLLDKGADIKSKDIHGDTPLFWAAKYGHSEIIQLLLDKGADIESKDNQGDTPLFWAAENGHSEIIQLLLNKDANIKSKDNQGNTPLFWAAKYKHSKIVQLLLNKGANIESKNNRGETLLSWAIIRDRQKIVQLLIDNGADIWSRDHNGKTPLQLADEHGHREIVHLLSTF